jgi:protein tyrosine phosphatase domain-containing protein 1
MAGRIHFYNFSWRDMGVPSLDKIMDIVQVRLVGP